MIAVAAAAGASAFLLVSGTGVAVRPEPAAGRTLIQTQQENATMLSSTSYVLKSQHDTTKGLTQNLR